MFQWITVGEDDVLFADMGQLIDRIGMTLLWITLALAVIVVGFGIAVRFLRPAAMKSFAKYAVGITVGYSVSVGGVMLVLKFMEMKGEESFQPTLFWPLCALLLVAAVSALVMLVLYLFCRKGVKIGWIVCGSLFGAAAVVALVLLWKYYSDVIIPQEYYEVSPFLLTLLGALLVVVIAAIDWLFGKKDRKTDHTRSIVFAAVCITLSFALSYIRLFKLPQGGSVTLASLVPLMIYSYMFGVRKGIFAGLIYGVLQAIQDPWIIHPVQFLLDYPIAFAAIGVAGMFRNLKVFAGKPQIAFGIGAVVASVLRYLSHVISGIFAFSVYAPEGFSAVAWGFLYNTFVFADILIAIVAGVLLFSSKFFVSQCEAFAAKNAPAVVSQETENLPEDQKK